MLSDLCTNGAVVRHRAVGNAPISVRKMMTDLPAEGAAADDQSRQDIVTHGIGFACGLIYAMSIVITDGQCDSA